MFSRKEGIRSTEAFCFRIVLDELSTIADHLGDTCEGIFHPIKVG